jgi:hypothetical protein
VYLLVREIGADKRKAREAAYGTTAAAAGTD